MATMAKAIPKPEVAAEIRKRIATLTNETAELRDQF